MFNFTVSLNDPSQSPEDGELVTDVSAAASEWSNYLNGLGSMDIVVNVGTTTRANGGWEDSVPVGTNGSKTVYESGVAYELQTGNDPNGSAPDLFINVDPNYLSTLWLDPTNEASIPSNETDGLSVFMHEIGHGLGIAGWRDPDTGALPNYESTWDQLVTLDANGNAYFTGANAESVYGSAPPVTTLKNGEQYYHLGNSVSDPDGQDLMNGVGYYYGTEYPISPLDVAIMQDLGLSASGPSANFAINDATTGQSFSSQGSPYNGPVSQIQSQYINTSPDNLNIAAEGKNLFIHTGSGVDAIDASRAEGVNVLDGGTNSNFLVGSATPSGVNTFFVDDRSPSSDIWSTVANFITGDAATVFGITPSNSTLNWVNNEGAAGYQGLTLHATSGGHPEASLTLTGYTTADLSNGRLTTSFGTETDGTPYLYVHANA